MPIRIRKDKTPKTNSRGSSNSGKNRNTGNTVGGSGISGGMIASLAPMAINLFRKNPKIGIVIVILAIVGFFLFSSGNSGGGSSNNNGQSDNEQYQDNGQIYNYRTGMEMDDEIYDRAEVYEPLAANSKNILPMKVSLKSYCPARKNQGSQGSCVGWASAYAARTILYARQTGKDPNDAAFSPSYLYNQIALTGCQGSYLQNAMETMKRSGVAPLSEFSYTEKNCSKKPNISQKELASQFKTRGFQRLSIDGNNYKTNLQAIKQNLAQGAPVVIGMMVGGTFMNKMNGQKIWSPTQRDRNSIKSFGGHAMCVIGYDDNLNGGSFQIMNSWGTLWGDGGTFYVSYKDFQYFNREAYGLYPMGTSEKTDPNKMSASIGLVYNSSVSNIDLKYQGGITFKTKSPIKMDTDFKVEVTNSVECYVYVFGEETDGSNYVLFPYTSKHSPYCGITGTRVFPRGYSMYADDLGTTDRMAVIVSKEKLDYGKYSSAITKASGYTYEQKVKNALKNILVDNIDFKGGKTFSFECDVTSKNSVAIIIEIDKSN